MPETTESSAPERMLPTHIGGEIDYWLAQASTGRGYMQRAVQTLIKNDLESDFP